MRTHTEILLALTMIAGDLRALGDEGKADAITVAFKTPQLNRAHNGVRAIAERGNAHATSACVPGGSGRSSPQRSS
ncbi:hypothetical protein ABT297_20000 [Dactylosporangium sp. NPDC000555]|uniref:hypothetical protein n=1 Tax=Dactylosporangium sp. NPDC000555 TaxID=3154260 RepID=UPI0033177038